MAPPSDSWKSRGCETAGSNSATAADSLESAIYELLSDAKDPTKLEVRGKRVLLRADLNVPLSTSSEGKPTIDDDNRVLAALPTIQLLAGNGAKVVIASHLGRPKVETNPEHREKLSLAPVGEALAALLPTYVGMTRDCVGADVEERVMRLKDGEVLLLENTRFHKQDTKNDPVFAERLSHLADIFVNDAFGVRPFGVVIGGAKVADKLGVIETLIDKADMVLIGGKMAFTFLAATGVKLHESQLEPGLFEDCRRMMNKAAEKNVRLILPMDVLVANSLEADASTLYVSELNTTCCTDKRPCVEDQMYGADIGPETIQLFQNALAACKTIFWNGPVGKFEVSLFEKGTFAIAESLREATQRNNCITVVGGGDSVNALRTKGYESYVTHVSTGGGASLELIEHKAMPGLQALASMVTTEQ